MNKKEFAGIVQREFKLLDTKLTTLEGTVLSIYLSSLTIKHSCTKFSAFIEADSGFYCCPSCNMVCMASVTTTKPNVSFCFIYIENKKNNVQLDTSNLEKLIGHKVLNQVKLAKNLCKVPSFLLRLQII